MKFRTSRQINTLCFKKKFLSFKRINIFEENKKNMKKKKKSITTNNINILNKKEGKSLNEKGKNNKIRIPIEKKDIILSVKKRIAISIFFFFTAPNSNIIFISTPKGRIPKILFFIFTYNNLRKVKSIIIPSVNLSFNVLIRIVTNPKIKAAKIYIIFAFKILFNIL